MDTLLVGAGIALVAAAIVGGGLKGFNVEVPVVDSTRRQVGLALFGIGLLAVGMVIRSYDDGGTVGGSTTSTDRSDESTTSVSPTTSYSTTTPEVPSTTEEATTTIATSPVTTRTTIGVVTRPIPIDDIFVSDELSCPKVAPDPNSVEVNCVIEPDPPGSRVWTDDPAAEFSVDIALPDGARLLKGQVSVGDPSMPTEVTGYVKVLLDAQPKGEGAIAVGEPYALNVEVPEAERVTLRLSVPLESQDSLIFMDFVVNGLLTVAGT